MALLALKRIPFAHFRAKLVFYAGFEPMFEGWRGLGSTIAGFYRLAGKMREVGSEQAGCSAGGQGGWRGGGGNS